MLVLLGSKYALASKNIDIEFHKDGFKRVKIVCHHQSWLKTNRNLIFLFFDTFFRLQRGIRKCFDCFDHGKTKSAFNSVYTLLVLFFFGTVSGYP